VYLMSQFYSNRENLVLAKYTCFTVSSVVMEADGANGVLVLIGSGVWFCFVLKHQRRLIVMLLCRAKLNSI